MLYLQGVKETLLVKVLAFALAKFESGGWGGQQGGGGGPQMNKFEEVPGGEGRRISFSSIGHSLSETLEQLFKIFSSKSIFAKVSKKLCSID